MSILVVNADSINLNHKSLGIVYRNNKVDAFLDNEDKFCISSAKGWGKTFLLKVKRKNIQSVSGNICLPIDRLLDSPTQVRINSENVNYLKDYTNWVQIWKTAISLCVIRFIKDNFYENYEHLIENLDDVFKVLIFHTPYYSACAFFNYLLTLSKKDLNNVLKKSHETEHLMSHLKSQISIFIDRVDEAFIGSILIHEDATNSSRGSTDKSFWYFSQYALIEAIAGLRNRTHHLKIYCSIREEVLIESEHYTELNQQIRELIVNLDYSFSDLYEMFKLYVENLDDKHLFDSGKKFEDFELAFFGFTTIPHTYATNISEKPFKYIYRHTLKRPRDIMDICRNILENKTYNDLSIFKRIVNETSTKIVREYIQNTGLFLKGITSKDIESMFSFLYANIMNRKMLRDICRQYNLSSNEHFDDNDSSCTEVSCSSCERKHVFCSMYNIGLIGILTEGKLTPNKFFQEFLSFGHSKKMDKFTFPHSEIYLVHPSLNYWIADERKNNITTNENGRSKSRNDFYHCSEEIVVGDEMEFDLKNIDDIVGKLNTSRKIFVSSTSYDLIDLRHDLKVTIENLGFKKVLCSEMPDFPVIDGLHSHDNCIEVVKNCDTFILVINSRYGGIYSGSLYRNELHRIREDICITWAEFYYALKMKKQVLTFIRDKVWTERDTYKFNLKKGVTIYPKHAEDSRVFDFIDYVVKCVSNNWINTFKDSQELFDLVKRKLI